MDSLHCQNRFLFNILSLIEGFNENIDRKLSDRIQSMSLSPHERAFFNIFQDILNASNEWHDSISNIKIPLRFYDLTSGYPLESISFNDSDSAEVLCKFERDCSYIDALQTKLIKEFCNSYKDLQGVIYSVLSYILGELICNIQEHSSALYGYVYMGADKEKQNIYISIADNGITIPGSYMVSGRKEYQSMIGLDSLEALRYSIRGLSTKNRPLNENRGYGISTNRNMIVDGLKGEFVILSGNNLYSNYANNEMYIGLPESVCFDGTIVFVTLPMKVDKSFDFYNYLG